MNKLITFVSFLFLTSGCLANDDLISDAIAKPCSRNVSLNSITKDVIKLWPMRSVNLIFPFKLEDSKTTYIPSASNIWGYKKAGGGKVVPLYFKSFNGQWGEVQDFSMIINGFVVSLALKAVKNPASHCSNIVFTLSEKEKAKLEKKEKKDHLAMLNQEYDLKLKNLDKKAEQIALKHIGSLINFDPDRTKVYEEAKYKTAIGDEIVLYADDINNFGQFSIMKIELENKSDINPLYINSLDIGIISDAGQRTSINGYSSHRKKMDKRQKHSFTFSTTDKLPDTNGYIVLNTDQGKVELLW